MYSYIILMSLAYHPYVLVCHLHVTRIHSYVTRCHLYVLVCHLYEKRTIKDFKFWVNSQPFIPHFFVPHFYQVNYQSSLIKTTYTNNNVFFSIWVFFYRHWRFTGQQGKGGDHLLFHSATSTRLLLDEIYHLIELPLY